MIFNQAAIEKLEAISDVDWIEAGKDYTSDDLACHIADYDACITSWGSCKFTPQVLQRAKKLKFIGHAAGTVVPIVDEAVFSTGITVVNANSALARSTAELALTLMMAGAWEIYGYNLRLKQGQWSKNSSETVLGLYRQTIGLIGYGDISRELIRLLKPFDARILLYSGHCTKAEAEDLGVELCPLEELLKSSRIISLHNTLTPSTRGMLGKKELAMIRDQSLLVNTARGPIIDEKALLQELESGRILAALDVYEQEPLDPNHNLLKLPNVLCAPHIGGFSSYWKTRLGETVIDDLARFIKGQPVQGEITAAKFKRLTPR